MPSTTDDQSKDEHRGIFALFKSESGAGKSVGALSFPDPFVFDHDRKMPAIAKKHFPGKKISWGNFDNVFEIGAQLKEFVVNGCPYETLIGDTLTSLSYTCLKTIDDVKGVDILSMLGNVKASSKGNQTIELRGYDYYNGEDNFLKYYLDTMKFLWARDGNPKHVILCAHVLTSESTDIKTKLVTKTRRIVTAGKNIAAYIPAQFDEVWHFAVGTGDIGPGQPLGVRHFLSTEAIGEDSAKTAYRLPKQIDFTDKSLYDLIKAEISQKVRLV